MMLQTILSNTNIPSETIGEEIMSDILSKNDYGKKHYVIIAVNMMVQKIF